MSCPVRVAARAIASPCDLNQIEYFICNVFFYIVNYHDSMHKCVRVQIYHSSSFCTFPAKCLPPFSSSSINRGLHWFNEICCLKKKNYYVISQSQHKNSVKVCFELKYFILISTFALFSEERKIHDTPVSKVDWSIAVRNASDS